MLRPTVNRPVCLGFKHPSGSYDQIFVTVRQLRVCWCRVLSLTRERVGRLQLLLGLASAVILGSESRGTRDTLSYTRYTTSARTAQKTPPSRIPPLLRVRFLRSCDGYWTTA
jgi:hypothetical protein